jgi:hypothetical protein
MPDNLGIFTEKSLCTRSMTMYELASGLLYYFLVIPSDRPVPLQSIASDRSHRKPSLPFLAVRGTKN